MKRHEMPGQAKLCNIALYHCFFSIVLTNCPTSNAQNGSQLTKPPECGVLSLVTEVVEKSSTYDSYHISKNHHPNLLPCPCPVREQESCCSCWWVCHPKFHHCTNCKCSCQRHFEIRFKGSAPSDSMCNQKSDRLTDNCISGLRGRSCCQSILQSH